MKEIRNIITAFKAAVVAGRQAALATVVHVEGSSYRRPGARMLITEDGELTGAISGGCLEGDALRKALLVMTQQQPMLVTYDTMDDDDAKFGVGLGCNGIIQVLIEPVNAQQANNPIQLLEAVAARRQMAVLVTLFSLERKKDAQQGTFILLTDDGKQTITKNTGVVEELLINDAATSLKLRAGAFKNYLVEQQQLTAFIEVIRPATALVIVGAGNDVQPLVQMAGILGWDCTVADGRPTHAKRDRFASACQVLVSKPEKLLSHLVIDDQTVFVLMTHNYQYDLEMLCELVKKDIVFIGMLGPRKKLERMLTEMADQGIILNEKQLACIYSPVGLDIGAETPEEIALSILAEINGVLAGKSGRPLREHAASIHNHSLSTIEQVRVTSVQ